MDDEPFTVDALLSPQVAAYVGDGRVASHIVVIVESVSEAGSGMSFVVSEGTTQWHAMGMLHSALRRIEADDLRSWEGEPE